MAITASVYIWYPSGSHIGHASMFIGTHEFNKSFEDIMGPSGVPVTASLGNPVVRADLERFYGNAYVSWWPDDTKSFNKAPQDRNMSLWQDKDAEGSWPHTTYRVHNLNGGSMWAEWKSIMDKKGGNYNLLRKNCSTIVLRVLKAGGVMSKMSIHKRAWFTNNLYVTPKNVAQVCNDLRDNGHADKVKADTNYPTKSSATKLDRLLGMR
ncbi:hypothetical protein [Roseomonas indoligenes]|uniref:DUF4105 domain-containing protein n=1 Tax=Roseomonas indoligenes TaxID=2820811 RepID=A0A940N037_9PROT|nr:hypothetical protein [Pararoseomonas indoligenes]MBP0494312.1 hypothetical protein [Pararoseomonas indoligenes]